MRVIVEEMWDPLTDKKTLMTLIGDGRTDKRILPEIFKRYNGKEIFNWCPWPIQKMPGKGFSILKSIKHLSITKSPRTILFIVDREHLNGKSLEYCQR